MLSGFTPLSLRSQVCDFNVQCRDLCCDPELYQVALPEPGQNFSRVSWLIQQGRLLPMTGLLPTDPVATNTAQRIEISVPLIVDVPYIFFTGSELVFNSNASQDNGRLEVLSTLTLRGSHLHGCERMWDGIFVNSGASLLAYNNCIEDGRRAIRLLDGARYELVRNSFQRNYVSIFAGNPDLNSTVATNLFSVGNGIIGNDISGLAPMLETVTGATRPGFGIQINQVNEMTIGLIGTNPVTRNDIHDFGATSTPGVGSSSGIGISSTNCNLTLNNTRFFNIGEITSIGGGPAIEASSIGMQFALNVNGLGGLAASPFTFQDCETCIRSKDNILTVKNSRFERATDHIRMDFPQFPHRFTVTNNYFEQYREFGLLSSAGVYQAGTVENNVFEDDSPELPQFNTNTHPRRSINSAGVIAQPTSNNPFFRVRYNQFFDRQKNFPPGSLDWGNIGLSMWNIRDVADVDDNDFTQEHISQQVYDYHGIRAYGCRNNQIHYNTSTGVAGNSSLEDPNFPVGMAAIDFYESGNNNVRCNVLSNVRDGLRFNGLACDGSVIHGNSMNGHNQNLRLTAGTIVGPQPKRWNTWPSNAGLWEANYETAQQLWDLSLFRIQFQETPGSIYWPRPRNSTPAQDFFLFMSGPTTIEDYCARGGDDEKELTTADDLALANQYPAYKGYTATQWEADYWLYDRLHASPQLRTAGNGSDAYYTAQNTTNIGRLHSAIEQYGAIGAIPSSIEASLEANYTQTSAKLAEIAAKHVEMAAAASNHEQGQILQDLQSLGAALQNLITAKANLSATHLSERSNKITALQTHLSSITPGNLPEQNLKSVMAVLTDAVAANAGDAYTTAQTAVLEDIAAQCRYAGGYGVVLARIVLKKNLAKYNNEVMCPQIGGAEGGGEDRSPASDLSAAALTLNPNPVANTLQVSLPSAAFTKGQVRVLDPTGRQVRSLALLPGSSTATIELYGLPNGSYLLEAIVDGQRLPVRRFVKHSQ